MDLIVRFYVPGHNEFAARAGNSAAAEFRRPVEPAALARHVERSRVYVREGDFSGLCYGGTTDGVLRASLRL